MIPGKQWVVTRSNASMLAEEVDVGECVLGEMFFHRVWEIDVDADVGWLLIDGVRVHPRSWIGGMRAEDVRKGTYLELRVGSGDVVLEKDMAWLLGFFVGTGGRTMRGWCASYRSEEELLYVMQRVERCASLLGIRGKGWSDHRVDPMKGRRRLKVERELWSSLKAYLSEHFPLLGEMDWIPYTISTDASKFYFELSGETQKEVCKGILDAGYVGRGGYIRRNSAELWRLLLLRGGYCVRVNELDMHIQSRGIRSRILGEPRWSRVTCYVRITGVDVIVERERVLVPVRSVRYVNERAFFFGFPCRIENAVVRPP